MIGWRQSSGDLWDINTLVSVDLPAVFYSGDMLIESVSFVLTDSGQVTRLSLVKPDAYQPQPVIALESDPGRGAFKGATR